MLLGKIEYDNIFSLALVKRRKILICKLLKRDTKNMNEKF